jgi:hypothetical protein
MAKPKLALIPSAQGSKFYSVLPSSGVGDFNFTRSGSATRINSQGLIESVANGVSRLNYPMIDGVQKGCPHHILEPQRTNIIPYSEDLTQETIWTATRCNITANQITSPDGALNADLLTVTDGSMENYVQTNVPITVSGTKQTVSCFVKKGTNDFAHILLWDTASNGSRQWFDVNNGRVESSTAFGSGISVDSASIENYGNGWFRCIVVFNCSFTSVRTRISASNGDGQTNGTIGKTIFIWGYQVESNSSYPTSYIPNYGTSAGVTRSAETANGSGDASTFNDSEGVLMAEISALDNDGTSRRISLSSGSTSQRVSLEVEENANDIQAIVVSGTSQVGMVVSLDGVTLFNKIAFKYKENDFAIWANGFELDTDTVGITPTGLSELAFDDGGGGADFYGNTKQIQYYDTALTDSELETLTSWVSFQDMAEGQLYTIE